MYPPSTIFTYLIFMFTDLVLVVFTPKAYSENFTLLRKITGASSLFSYCLASSYYVWYALALWTCSDFIIFVTIQRWKFLPFSLMYYKNESIAHRPLRCVIVFENPDRNIAMDPLDIMECMPMSGSLKPNFYSPITYIVTLILYRALPE